MIKPGDKVFLWSNMNLRGVVTETFHVKNNTWHTSGTAPTRMVVRLVDKDGVIHELPASELMREE